MSEKEKDLMLDDLLKSSGAAYRESYVTEAQAFDTHRAQVAQRAVLRDGSRETAGWASVFSPRWTLLAAALVLFALVYSFSSTDESLLEPQLQVAEQQMEEETLLTYVDFRDEWTSEVEETFTEGLTMPSEDFSGVEYVSLGFSVSDAEELEFEDDEDEDEEEFVDA